MVRHAKTAIVFDLEFTAWQGSLARNWLDPGEFREVVQIGAVSFDADSLARLGEFGMVVRPRLNPLLSDYFVTLTGISNETLKTHGRDFAEAYASFVRFAAGGTIHAYGRDDLVIEENLRLYGLRDMPPLPAYRDLRPWLRENGIDTERLHAGEAARAAGAAFGGRLHDALDDARALALAIETLMKRGATNPFRDHSGRKR